MIILGEVGRIWKYACAAYFKLLPRNLFGRTERKNKHVR
jgi:hypothetical protein